jgi:hypothetical protein
MVNQRVHQIGTFRTEQLAQPFLERSVEQSIQLQLQGERVTDPQKGTANGMQQGRQRVEDGSFHIEYYLIDHE